MFKKILFAVSAFIATAGFAFAAVDLNKADNAALDGVKGIGPKMSKTILDERKKNGDFKDWADFEARVKGIGDKNSEKFSQEGVTINGKSKSSAPAKKEVAKADAKGMKKETKAEAKEMKAEAKSTAKEVKHEAKEAKNEVKADTKEAKK